jgi:hypothetical protein
VAADPGPELRVRFEDVFRQHELDVSTLWLPCEPKEPVTKESLETEISRLLHKTEPRPLMPYSADSRTVIRSESYRAFETGEKQNVAEPSATAFEDLATVGTYCDMFHLRLLREKKSVLRGVADGVLQGHKPPGTAPAISPFHQFVPAFRLTPETLETEKKEQS